jgi:integrase
MKIIYNDDDNDDKNNFLLIDSTTNTKEDLYYVIINKDKVSKTAGSIEIPITNTLLKSILKVYLHEYAQSNIYLFETKKKTPYTKRQIQYTINNMFDDKVLNVYNLRSAYISNFYKHNLDYESRRDLALQMRHSKDTAELIYCKFF